MRSESGDKKRRTEDHRQEKRDGSRQMQNFFYIIVVTFNAGRKLVETLNSIRMQTYSNYRVIIKDGGSNDSSIEEMKERFHFEKDVSWDKKMRLIRTRDAGIYDAMNQALAEVWKEEEKALEEAFSYCYFLNCGDTFAGENVLQALNSYMKRFGEQKRQEAIFYGDVFEEKTGQRVASNPKIDDFACYRNVPCHQACFYDLRLMRGENFDTRWQVRSDYEHFLRLFYKKAAKTHYIPMTIANYEGGGFSEQERNRKKSEEERRNIISLYLPEKKIHFYDLLRTLTLQPLRAKMAANPKTAGAYQAVKRGVYRLRGKKEEKR